jgi:uncharacterized membrane protein
VVVRCLALQFNFDYRVTVLNVLWALGWSMIALAALVRLPAPVVGAVGIAIVAAHNLLDPIRPAAFGAFAPIWTLLHVQGFVLNEPGRVVLAAYPILPWIGVTAAGFGLGALLEKPPAERRQLLLRIGLALIAAFLVLRGIDVYGDPVRWSVQRSAALTLLSFLNTTKYPPSLLFLLMTLGPALLLLRAFDRPLSRWMRPLQTYGRVPLFYFVLHLAMIHAFAVFVCWLSYGAIHWMFESPDLGHFPITEPPGWPRPLPIVYAIWIGIVATMYPLCRWYDAVKTRSTNRWLSYL